MQIRAGADAIQIFDSWGGILAGQDYEAASLRWIRDIIAALPKGFPIILYAKGTPSQFTDQAFSGASVLGVDWTVDLGIVRKLVPGNIALQGNLDPVLMNTTPEIVRHEVTRLLDTMRGANGHIFNLGHGIMPQAKIECVEALVDTVTRWKNWNAARRAQVHRGRRRRPHRPDHRLAAASRGHRVAVWKRPRRSAAPSFPRP